MGNEEDNVDLTAENSAGNTETDLASLKQQRSTMKRNISNLKVKIEREGNKPDLTILECRLQILESYFKQIMHIQSLIEKACPADSCRSDLEELFIVVKSKLLSFIKPKRDKNLHEGSSFLDLTTTSSISRQNRLPKLKLPQFTGKYVDYKRFISAFSNLVHDDSTITPVDKFNYLLNCLSGQALAVVEAYQVTEENYPKALQRLKERYDNDVLIFLDHINTLFDLPVMVRGDPNSLRNILDSVTAIRGSLLSLGSEVDVMNAIIIHIVTSKLDTPSTSTYKEKQQLDKLPTWEEFYKILSRRCQFLESQGTKPEERQPKPAPKRQSHSFTNSRVSCIFCQNSEHTITNCGQFLNLSVSERFVFVKRSSLCINCLRKGHSVSKCQSKSRCHVCKTSHHTHLHIHNPSPSDQQLLSSSSGGQGKPIHSTPISLVTYTQKRSIIPTAVILIKDKYGSFQPVRALLDSCSEINFITEEAAKRLQLTWNQDPQEVSGIAEIRTQLKYSVHTTIKSRIIDFEWSSNFAITKTISTAQPAEHINVSTWQLPNNIELADPLFFKPHRIDVLISTEVFFCLLLDGKISLGNGLPCLVNTVFGWIVGGKFDVTSKNLSRTCNVAVRSPSLVEIDTTLKRFWEVEEVSVPIDTLSPEERDCEQHFRENVKICENGRLELRLPFKEPPELLGNSLANAQRRFLSLERRLERSQSLKNMYVDFMEEYLSLGHMSPLNDLSAAKVNYFIPHHCILRPQSSTTKLRVVFDASANTSSNRSLNDILMVGPTIQQDLIITLLGFRFNRFALTADIRKMYRQFLIHEKDRNFQLILWRSRANDPLHVYQLNTITYGMASAPFLAVRSLFHIAETYSDKFPVGSQVLREDLYVDDLLTGADSTIELQRKKIEITNLLATSGLELAKWNSNNIDVVADDISEKQIKAGEEDIAKALGLWWKPKEDLFCFQFDLQIPDIPSKRSVLSIISRIYDLLGLISPVVIRCKILLQELWIQNLDWDQPLPYQLLNMWNIIAADLAKINDIEVPRYVHTSNNTTSEIHGFADASQRAYGCCLYVRTKVNGVYKIAFLLAKSKVAPIKAQSLPRLELCAAVLLNKTWKRILHKLSRYKPIVYFWTDSKIVLQWLKMHSSSLNCFVGNRVAELQEDCKDIHWRHVPSKENPADIVSRGCSAVDLPNTIWFSGPDFLLKESKEWPTQGDLSHSGDLEKRKPVSIKCIRSDGDTIKSIILDIIDRYSSYYQILRILSFIFRVFNKCPVNRQQTAAHILHLSREEMDITFWRIISEVQRLEFKEELANLSNDQPVKGSLAKLSPFLQKMYIDDKIITILRVGGRLQKAPIAYDAKFPALLPKTHRFTQLYVEYLHKRELHAGPKILISLLRQRVWVVNARELVRKVVRNCTHCFCYKPKLLSQVMGDLPADRLQAHRPFLISGVDFCGPFFTSYRIRGKQPYKTYAAIFICFSSKAVHLELVSDLSTNSFLLSLKRFVSRRGIPLRLYCDNATNFVGAQSKLNEFSQRFFNKTALDDVLTYSSQTGFEFRFIPPRAPHFGGLWEAAVKSAKTLLVKNAAHSNLTFEELQTVLMEVESILNSRPITYLSNDPNDGEAITPAHLLIGCSLKSLPEETFDCKKVSYLTSWQRVTYLKQRFWEIWRRDYLHDLQQRSKWLQPQANIKVGQLVIVHEDNLPPQQWLLARITETIPGADGRVRVVQLRTSKGSFRRPIHKVAPLPLNEDS